MTDITPIASRITALVAFRDNNNVRAAARRVGIPHATLARIAAGRTPNPRAGALTRIASAYGVTTDWLLTGEGEGQTTAMTQDLTEDRTAKALSAKALSEDVGSDSADFFHLVRELALPRPTEVAVWGLVTATRQAEFFLAYDAGFPFAEVVTDTRHLHDRAEARAWTIVLLDMLKRWGRDELRRRLIRNTLLIASRFTLPLTGELKSSFKAGLGAKTMKELQEREKQIHAATAEHGVVSIVHPQIQAAANRALEDLKSLSSEAPPPSRRAKPAKRGGRRKSRPPR